MTEVSVVVPARNEAPRIGRVVADLAGVGDVLVVDDASTDGTAVAAREAGADVIRFPRNRGYVPALRRGLRTATGDVVVTMDADGEHPPGAVDRLVDPVANDALDLVLGARPVVPRRSERLLNALVRLAVGVSDAYTGFRALDPALVSTLDLGPGATCGTLVLDAAAAGARVGEVEVPTREVDKSRGVAWSHLRHAVRLLRRLIRR